MLADVTPAIALQLLKHGNNRFSNNIPIVRDSIVSIHETKDSQFPFAVILSCIDSRTSAELIFDQGFGDIFSVRIAGNVISPDVLGSLEYSTAIVGSKLIVVLGHTNCGAIIGACDHVQMGHVTELLSKIKPAMEEEITVTENRTGKNKDFVHAVTKLHIKHSAKLILEGSSIISELVSSGKVGIVPAMYEISTGKVHFYDEDAILPDASQA